MNILIAPTALKGSLSPFEAAEVMASAVPPGSTVVCCPIADGGDGTLECLVQDSGGRYHEAVVTGPIHDRLTKARWGILGDGVTAVVEIAEASGLRLIRPQEYDALHATTFGAGELLRDVLNAGHRRILVGLGGSATNDGGAGIARALGVRFLDVHGQELPNGGIHLGRLHRIDRSRIHAAVGHAAITALADVDIPLCGPGGAAVLFAPQKGATRDQVELLDAAMRQYETILSREKGVMAGDYAGTGAAGGAGAGLAAFCGATIVSGADYILDALRIDERLQACDMVLTAEGKVDSQTRHGKALAVLARRAQRAGRPVHVFVGRMTEETGLLCAGFGFASAHPVTPPDLPMDEAIRNARGLLAAAVGHFFNTRSPVR